MGSLNVNKSVQLAKKCNLNISKDTWIDRFFIRYYLIVYYVYSMSVGIFFEKGSFWGVFLNLLLLIILIYSSVKNNIMTRKFLYVYFYISFILLLICIQSSNYYASFKNLGQYTLTLLCLPLGFSILSSKRKFREFLWTGVICMFLFLINFMVVNIFNFGGKGYAEEGFKMGNLFSDAMYQIVYFVISIYLFFVLFPSRKRLLLLLAAICSIIVIVSMKRTTIFALLLGVCAYQFICFQSGRQLKGLFRFHLKYFTKYFLIFLMFSPFFISYFLVNLNARKKTFEDAHYEVNNELRIAEFRYITEEILCADKASTLLFGKETFNLIGTYGGGRFGGRQIHTDYSMLLHGTGVIGCLLWVLVHLCIVLWIIRMKNNLRNPRSYLIIIYSLFFSLILAQCVIMGSGSIGLVVSSSFYYAILGGILRCFYNNK